MAFVWGLLHYLLLALATWYESKIWFRGFDIHRRSSWKYWLRLRLVGSSTLFDPLISRLGSSIQIRRLPQNTTPLLFSYSPWTCYEQTGKYFKQRQVVLILNFARGYHPPSYSHQRSARILDPGNSRRESASFFLARPREMIFKSLDLVSKHKNNNM